MSSLIVQPSAARWLTFLKALAAVLFYSAWPSLTALMWFMCRLFATATLCVLNPPGAARGVIRCTCGLNTGTENGAVGISAWGAA